MQINKTNNVIFLREFESNVISEAFVVLKENIKITNLKNDISSKNENINILKEAEFLINQRLNQNNLEYEKFKLNKLEQKVKILKVINIITIITLMTVIILNY